VVLALQDFTYEVHNNPVVTMKTLEALHVTVDKTAVVVPDAEPSEHEEADEDESSRSSRSSSEPGRSKAPLHSPIRAKSLSAV
jgi:hypothetical protein